VGPAPYLDFIRRATQAVDIPVIASINGITDHHWVDYAQQIEAAGAAALELNVYFIPADIETAGYEVEQRYVDVLKAVKLAVKIPIAVKLSPYFSSIGYMALQLERAGADGLVLFNRFYEPDIDLFELTPNPTLTLSQAEEIRVPLLWIGILSGRIGVSLAASTGVETSGEVMKYLLAGADVVQTASALLRHGPEHMKALLEGVELWLASRDLDSLERVRGVMSQRKVADPNALVRGNYIKVLQGSSRWE
jgi:dihydroorotate dehydrogenase (fumarate)